MEDKLESQFQAQLKKFEEDFFSPTFTERQSKIFKEVSQQQTITENDIKLWQKYRDIVKERKANSPNKKAFFSFDDIEALGLETDLIFVYGAKNIGKTVATSRLVTKILDKKKTQIFMLRNTRTEIDKGFNAQLAGEEWPFIYKPSRGELERKPGYLDNRGSGISNNKKDSKKVQKENETNPFAHEQAGYNPDHVGFATSITGLGLRGFQGPAYKYMKAIIWDECNDLGDIDEVDIIRTLVFVLSVERNNKDLKVYLLGNLLRHQESGAASNIFLDFFGIPHGCNLKYWKMSNGLKLLYINTGQAGDLYDGVKEQKFSEMFGSAACEDLNSNQPLPYSAKVLSRAFFLMKCEPLQAFVYHNEEQFWILYLGMYNRKIGKEEQSYYIMKIERFNTAYNHPGYYPVSDNLDVVNQFGNVRYIKPKKAGKFIERIFKLNQHKMIFFTDDNTRIHWTNKASIKLKSRYSTLLSPGF